MWSVHILNETVERELYSLPEEMQARFLRLVELIEHHGLSKVGMPHVRHVQGKLWEIRLSAKDQIGRGLYVTTSGQRVVSPSSSGHVAKVHVLYSILARPVFACIISFGGIL